MTDKILNLFFLLIIVNFSFGQVKNDNLTVKINLNFNQKTILFGEKYSSKNDTLTIETIRFYLSSFEINFNDDSTLKENDSYHLVDFEKPETLIFQLKKSTSKDIKSIKFNIGVDSLASVSGAMKDDLDATNGMYWSWQSGFINMKIEGKSSSCKTRKNQFHFHVGGYLQPNYAMREIKLNCSENLTKNNEIIIHVDLAKLFNEVSLSETNAIMIPGKEAMKIADLSTKMFSVE